MPVSPADVTGRFDEVFRVEVVPDGNGSCAVEVNGEIDFAAFARLTEVIAAGVDWSSEVAVDLQGVSFMDCAGLRALLVAKDHAADAGVRISFVGISPAVGKVLDLTGLADELLSASDPATS